MAVKIDLDAKRRAREVETPTFVLEGETFNLPGELPVGVFLSIKEMQDDKEKGMDALELILDTMLGDQKQKFLDLGPSLTDVMDLFTGLVDSYDVNQGEASDSSTS